MPEYDYTFRFGHIGLKPATISICNHLTGNTSTCYLKMDDSFVHNAPCPDVDLLLCADLLSLAAAVYAVDWLAVRAEDTTNQLRLVLPVWRVDLLSNSCTRELLESLLKWLTGDNWTIEWESRSTDAKEFVVQNRLFEQELKEVCLWSGGLDSMLGAAIHYSNTPSNPLMLVGTGASKNVAGVQRKTASVLRQALQRTVSLTQVPVYILEGAELPKHSHQRSRGFVFLIVGAIVAHLEGSHILHVFENGIGAINLSYSAIEVELDHTRSVHPRTLRLVGELVSRVFQSDFQLDNPFLFQTKGQMALQAKNLISRNPSMVPITNSCDSPHRQKNLPAQCGYCPSCLLRRQALAVAGITDRTRYALFNDRVPKREDKVALSLMTRQAERMERAISRDNPWIELVTEFPSLAECVGSIGYLYDGLLPSTVADNLVALYRTYSEEWRRVGNQMQVGLIEANAGSEE